MILPSGASALASSPAATCTTFSAGHQVALPTMVAARAASGWKPARVLLADGKMVMMAIDGDPRWFHQHDVAGINDHVATAGPRGRYHAAFDVLELGDRMFSVLPLAESLTAQLLDAC